MLTHCPVRDKRAKGTLFAHLSNDVLFLCFQRMRAQALDLKECGQAVNQALADLEHDGVVQDLRPQQKPFCKAGKQRGTRMDEEARGSLEWVGSGRLHKTPVCRIMHGASSRRALCKKDAPSPCSDEPHVTSKPRPRA